MMRVVVPATPGGLKPEVLPALLATGATVEVFPMLEVDSYYRALIGWWAEAAHWQQDLCIVEHDIEVNANTLERFDHCQHEWCAHSYPVCWGDIATTYGGPWGLGCVRFRWQLCAALPDLITESGESERLDAVSHHPRFSYQTLDATVTHWLKGPHRRRVCQHRPGVTHHHEYAREGAYAPGVLDAHGQPLRP